MKASKELKGMADRLEKFSEEQLGTVLDEELAEHATEAREHLETLAAELAEVGL